MPLPFSVLEDGWPQSTRSKEEKKKVPIGNREEMIHFQPHFTGMTSLPGASSWSHAAERTLPPVFEAFLMPLRCLCIDYRIL